MKILNMHSIIGYNTQKPISWARSTDYPRTYLSQTLIHSLVSPFPQITLEHCDWEVVSITLLLIPSSKIQSYQQNIVLYQVFSLEMFTSEHFMEALNLQQLLFDKSIGSRWRCSSSLLHSKVHFLYLTPYYMGSAIYGSTPFNQSHTILAISPHWSGLCWTDHIKN